MTDEQALLAAIRAAPDSDLPRLVYADWWEEHGQADRAELIRVGCEAARLYDDPARDVRLCELLARCRTLWEDTGYKGQENFAPGLCSWFAAELPGWYYFHHRLQTTAGLHTRFAVVNRGFVERVECDAAYWLAHGDDVLRRHPVRAVTLTTWPEVRIAPNSDMRYFGELVYGLAGDSTVFMAREVAAEMTPKDTRGGYPDDGVGALLRLRYPGVRFTLPPEPTGPRYRDAAEMLADSQRQMEEWGELLQQMVTHRGDPNALAGIRRRMSELTVFIGRPLSVALDPPRD